MKLYTYCLRHDNGAAPNPYWGICTLVICKPAIRRSANIGDWIVGLGSANSPIGDISNCIVYAMKVTEKMTIQEYDTFCRVNCSGKIPEWNNKDFRLRVGDCIYKFKKDGLLRMRPGIHDAQQRKRDLSGKYALLSDYFYYFGDKPVELPPNLYPLIHKRGHKSKANRPFVNEFIEWIENKEFKPNLLYGEPQQKNRFTTKLMIAATKEDCLSRSKNCI